jgi:uncharacterized protein YegL
VYRSFLLLTAIAVAGAALAPSAGAVADGGLHVRIDSADSSAYPQIRATVTLTDDGGRPIDGVPPAAFAAHLGAAVLPISAVQAATDANLPVTVVLVIDISGSMSGAPLDAAKGAAQALLAQLAPGDLAAIVAFGSAVTVVQPVTADKAALNNAINGLAPDGNTDLYDAVSRSAQLLQSAGTPRAAIVLLSDGQEYGVSGGVDRAGSLAAVASANAPVFAVGLGDSVDAQYLADLAQAARGQFLSAPTPDALVGLYTTIGSILRRQYVLTLDATALNVTSPSLRIDVSYQGQTAVDQASLNLPAAATIAPATAVASPVTAVAQPVLTTSQQSGGNVPVVLIAALAVGALVTGGGGFVFWRRRQRRRHAQEPKLVDRPLPTGEPRPGETPVAEPRARSGPREAWLRLLTSDGEKLFRIGESPVTIGFGPGCDLRMPDSGTGNGARARIWPRDGKFMLHTLSTPGSVTVGSKPAVWVVLEDGDDITFGASHLLFTTAPQQPAENSNKFL